MRCPAKIRPMRDINELEIECIFEDSHGMKHGGDLLNYAYPGSKTRIAWEDGDRRNFTGTFVECPVDTCILPQGHWGNHQPREVF